MCCNTSIVIFLIIFIFNSFTRLPFEVESRLVSEKIKGGENAESQQFPYMVSIQDNGYHKCGGGIIGEYFILSAAHCVINYKNNFDRSRLIVVVNTICTKCDDSPWVIRRIVEKAYVPAEYVPRHLTLVNRDKADISVLKLREPLQLGKDRLMKLELPKASRSPQLYVNKVAILSGFGVQDIELRKDSTTNLFNAVNMEWDNNLKFVEAIVLSREECQHSYEDIVYKYILCARVIQRYANVAEGVCSGDSGSPLVLNGNLAIGVLSSGQENCNETVHPGVYARISSYLTFIDYAKRDLKSPDIRSIAYRL